MIRNGLRVRAKTDKGGGENGEGSTSATIDTALIRDLALLVGETDLAEIEIERGDLRIRLTRHHRAQAPVYEHQVATTPLPATPAPAMATAAAAEPDHAGLVKSPMVGTVYRRSNPESKPFVEIGAVVKTGERVLLVEAMKTFNDIVAHRAGTVTAIMVDDGQPVEYGEPLLLIE